MKSALLATVSLLSSGIPNFAEEGTRPPNVVVFLVDDLGYGDLGFTGAELAETPNLDRFAAQNMVFRQAYTPSPHCSPTRAAILTGQYPHRLHITSWIGGRKEPRFENMRLPTQRTFLPQKTFTLAEYFKDRGYATAQLGKWHLGDGDGHPSKHGFDKVVAFVDMSAPGAPNAWYAPYPTLKDLDGPKGEYITDRLTDEAIRFIGDHREKPFFLMLQHFDVHDPLTAPEEMIKKYEARGRPRDKGFHHATYLAMIESVDRSFGRIMEALAKDGLADNTIVILFSDNGGVVGYANNAPFRAGKKWFYEGGIRVPMVLRAPGRTRAGASTEVPVSGIDFFPTLVSLSGGDPGALPTHFDGEDLSPLFAPGGGLKRDALFWHQPLLARTGKKFIPPQAVVRQGPWKLIHYYGGKRPSELYNLETDLGETTDLASQHPERVEALTSLLLDHVKSTGSQQVKVLPETVRPHSPAP